MPVPFDIRKPAAALLLAVLALAVAACGREDEPDLVNGKSLFIGKGTCGSCHTLSRAGTRGTQGPNLDQAFATARRDGLKDTTIEGVVRDQIGNVRMGSIMPEDLVTGDDARDVAAYVAKVAGAGGQDVGALAQVGQRKAGKPVAAKDGLLEIAADPTGALAFVASKATAEAGKIEFVMPNKSPIQHDIAVKDGGQRGKGPVVGQGGTSRFSADLKAGEYEFYCTVPGHEAGGMKGELTVK